MIELLTLITLMCHQPGVGHGDSANSLAYTRKVSALITEDAHNVKKECTKRLFKACTERHLLSKELIVKQDLSCLVEAL